MTMVAKTEERKGTEVTVRLRLGCNAPVVALAQSPVSVGVNLGFKRASVGWASGLVDG